MDEIPPYRFDQVTLDGETLDNGQLLLEIRVKLEATRPETTIPLIPYSAIGDIVSQHIEPLPPAPEDRALSRPHSSISRSTTSATLLLGAGAAPEDHSSRARSQSTLPVTPQGLQAKHFKSLLQPPHPSVSPFRPLSTSPTLRKPTPSIADTLAPKSLYVCDKVPLGAASASVQSDVRPPDPPRRTRTESSAELDEETAQLAAMPFSATAQTRRACKCSETHRRRPIPTTFRSQNKPPVIQPPGSRPESENSSSSSASFSQTMPRRKGDRPVHGEHCPLKDIDPELQWDLPVTSLTNESPPAGRHFIDPSETSYITSSPDKKTVCFFAIQSGAYAVSIVTTIPVWRYTPPPFGSPLDLASLTLANLPPALHNSLTLTINHPPTEPTAEPLGMWFSPPPLSQVLVTPHRAPSTDLRGSTDPSALSRTSTTFKIDFRPTDTVSFGWAPSVFLDRCLALHQEFTSANEASTQPPAAFTRTSGLECDSAATRGAHHSRNDPTNHRAADDYMAVPTPPPDARVFYSTSLDDIHRLSGVSVLNSDCYDLNAEFSSNITISPRGWKCTAMVFLDFQLRPTPSPSVESELAGDNLGDEGYSEGQAKATPRPTAHPSPRFYRVDFLLQAPNSDLPQVQLVQAMAQHGAVHWQLILPPPAPVALPPRPSVADQLFSNPANRRPGSGSGTSGSTTVAVLPETHGLQHAQLSVWVENPHGPLAESAAAHATEDTTAKLLSALGQISFLFVFEAPFRTGFLQPLSNPPAGVTHHHDSSTRTGATKSTPLTHTDPFFRSPTVSATHPAAAVTEPIPGEFLAPRLTLVDAQSQLGCLAVSAESPILVIEEFSKSGLFYLNKDDFGGGSSGSSDDWSSTDSESDESTGMRSPPLAASSDIANNPFDRTTPALASIPGSPPHPVKPPERSKWDFGGHIDIQRRRTMFRQLEHVRRVSLGPRALAVAAPGSGLAPDRRFSIFPPPPPTLPRATLNGGDVPILRTPLRSFSQRLDTDEIDWSTFNSPKIQLNPPGFACQPSDPTLDAVAETEPTSTLLDPPVISTDQVTLTRRRLEAAQSSPTPLGPPSRQPAAPVPIDPRLRAESDPDPFEITPPPVDFTLATPDHPVVFRDYGFSDHRYRLVLKVTTRPQTQSPPFTVSLVKVQLTVTPKTHMLLDSAQAGEKVPDRRTLTGSTI
ncbi:hypothetical protein BJ085DRAFT_39438, partial [Dimargaris cristalligena]